MSFQLVRHNNNIYTSGGMSSEISFVKYCANRDENVIYSGWDNNLRMVYDNIIIDTLAIICFHVRAREYEKCNKKVLYGPGHPSVPYITELCELVYLPSQLMLCFDNIESLVSMLKHTYDNGIQVYALICIDIRVINTRSICACIKFAQIPKDYLNLMQFLQTQDILTMGIKSENIVYQDVRKYDIPKGEHDINIFVVHMNSKSCIEKDLTLEWSQMEERCIDFDRLKISSEQTTHISDIEFGIDIIGDINLSAHCIKQHTILSTNKYILCNISYELCREFMHVNRIPIRGIAYNSLYMVSNPSFEVNKGFLAYTNIFPDISNFIEIDVPKEGGIVWFNDMNMHRHKLSENIKESLGKNQILMYINNINTLSHNRLQYIRQNMVNSEGRFKSYPRRDYISIHKLQLVIQRCGLEIFTISHK